ncbi:PrkA family serine protein kinase [Salmonella enterica]
MNIFDHYRQRYEAAKDEEFTLQDFLTICRQDRSAYANAAERLLMAIGEPNMVDTAQEPRLSRLFSNRVIARYPAFEEFYGMEDAIEQIVSYLKHAAQGLEEKKQILYLLGPVGGGKSSLAERLKSLMQRVPIYVLSANGERSPVNDHPLCLFNPQEDAQILEKEYGIPRRYLGTIMSPWAAKHLHEFGGDITKFRVVKVWPSILEQIAIAKTEPGDENNQDISALVGKVDIRKLEHHAQNDPDAYGYSGALCRANQGIMEFVEMFKAPIKVLPPLLTATQEGNYNGTEGISALPFNGIILAHSNESEWVTFRNNKNNEAFLDRVYIVKVPYCLRISEEIKIYEKLLNHSELAHAPCAPGTLETLSRFSTLSRLKEPENSSIYSKMRVYDGESLKDTDPKAKSYQEYRDYAGVDEGMNGLSTRFAFKILSRVFNFDHAEVAANPVHLFYVLEQQIEREQFPQEQAERYLEFLKVAIAKTEPGDENNQDISALVGKVDIRKLEHHAQNDPDAYGYSGALCRANQGIMEFVEMFKAPIKVLPPLLTATQEGNYNGTEGISALPFNGIILAHSNESEWVTFRNNKNNEAFLDRVYIVKVPYCLRISEEIKIYEKLLNHSELAHAPCAPGTLETLSRFSTLSRLKEPENSSIYSKMRVYDGESLKDTDPKAKSYQEYRDYAGVDEGMNGLSTRFAFKILSRVFNFDHAEVAANPVHLFYVLEQQIEREQFPQEQAERYLEFLKGYLIPKYAEFIGKEIQTAYLESYSEYGQNIFDRYVTYADFWIQDQEYRDPDTGQLFDRESLNAELEKIEKPAGISNPKDFRNEIVNFVLRARANNSGRNPNWTSYEKLRTVIEKKMFSNTEELLPVISFNAKTSTDEQKKHDDFVDRMMEKGYTRKQVRLLCEWYLRVRKSS